jgi:hypothetical protein
MANNAVIMAAYTNVVPAVTAIRQAVIINDEVIRKISPHLFASVAE